MIFLEQSRLDHPNPWDAIEVEFPEVPTNREYARSRIPDEHLSA